MGAALLLALFPALLLGLAFGGGDDASEGETINGTDADDTLIGSNANDYIDAGAGDDALAGGAGNDVLRGNLGSDYLEDTSGVDRLYGGYGRDALIAVELSGSGAADLLDGGANDDVLVGDNGDTMTGGSGTDEFDVFWRPGEEAVTITDFHHGTDGSDEPLFILVEQWDDSSDFRLTETADGVNVVLDGETVASLVGAQMQDVAGWVALQSFTDESIFVLPDVPGMHIAGTDGADSLFGGSGNDSLKGWLGPDWLSGAGGNDVPSGGYGADALFGGEGNDVLSGGGGDYLGGSRGDDRLDGGAGNDRLIGNAGNDTLEGGEGDDSLWSSVAGDTLIGGAGNDDFELSATLSGPVVVTDYAIGEDRITISGGSANDAITFTASNGGADTLAELNGTGLFLLRGIRPDQMSLDMVHRDL